MAARLAVLVLIAGCAAENTTTNATDNATGAATSTLVELDAAGPKPRRRPKKPTTEEADDSKTLEQLLARLFEDDTIRATATGTISTKAPPPKKKRRRPKTLDVTNEDESLDEFVAKLLASDDSLEEDLSATLAKLFAGDDLAEELSRQARELAQLLKAAPAKNEVRTVQVSQANLEKLFPRQEKLGDLLTFTARNEERKHRVDQGDALQRFVDAGVGEETYDSWIAGTLQSLVDVAFKKESADLRASLENLRKSQNSQVPVAAALLELVAGTTDGETFDFPCPHGAPCAGACVVGSGSRYVDGWYPYDPVRGFARGDVTVSRFTQPGGESHWFISNDRDPATASDDVDYLRTIKAAAAARPPEARSAWGIVDRASTVAHAQLGEEEARRLAADWPTRAPFVLLAARGAVCADALEKLRGEDVPGLLDGLLDGSKEGAKRVEDALARISRQPLFRPWKELAANWLLKVLDDGTLEDILQESDAQFREDVLVLAAVGVAIIVTVLAIALWLGRRIVFENVERPFFDAREDREDTLGVPPAPQIRGEGWASESDEEPEVQEVSFDPVPGVAWRSLVRSFDGHCAMPVALLLAMTLREAASTSSSLASAFLGAYQRRPYVVVALALDAIRRLALAGVALTRRVSAAVGAEDWRQVTKAAGDEAVWLMAIALARDQRDESLRDAICGALLAGTAALLAKVCRIKAARLAADAPLPRPSYAAAYHRVRAHLLLLVCVGLHEVVVVAVSVYFFRTRCRVGASWRACLSQKLRAVALCARTVSRTTQVFLHHCCSLLFGRDRMLIAAVFRYASAVFTGPLSLRYGRWLATPQDAADAFAGALRRHAATKPNPRRAVASYYCEFSCNCVDLVVAMTWYAAELVRGALEPTVGSVLFSLYAQHAFGRLRVKIAYHRDWRAQNARAKDNRALFEPAADDVVASYDDICVICHDGFEVPTGSRRLTRDTPIQLPRCAHILHRQCLEVCLENAHRTLRPLICPICTAPMRQPDSAPEETIAPDDAAPEDEVAPDLPVVGDFAAAAAAAPEDELE